jgi:hypothetical protein
VARKPEGPTKFDQFVRAFGVVNLARRLAVDESAIYHWLRGSTSPHPANAIKIQKLAKQRGIALSLDEIYQHFRDVANASPRLPRNPNPRASDAIPLERSFPTREE